MAVPVFHWADYLLFVLMLVVSCGVGIFFACRARRHSVSVAAHLTGHGKMKLIPCSFSISVTAMSAVFILGATSEIYRDGVLYCFYGVGIGTAFIFIAFTFAPVLKRLDLRTGYQYLETRFSRNIRLIGSAAFVLQMVFYTAVVLYAPALALSQVTSLSTETSIVIIGVVGTFYTSIGGIKAVIVTDVFQTVIILVGLVATAVYGTIKTGGVQVMFQKVKEGGKLNMELNVDPFVKHTWFGLVVGGGLGAIAAYISNQAILQRFMGLPSVRQAKLALLLQVVIVCSVFGLCCFIGFMLFAFYSHNDPIKAGLIERADQIFPYFMIGTIGKIPGLTGLFVAAIYSAALSTISSSLNALSVIAIVDFINPMVERKIPEGLTPRQLFLISVGIDVVLGIITAALALVIGNLGSSVLQISMSIFGMVGGPIVGLFINGVFFPCVNAWGAGAGFLTSLPLCLWLGIGRIFYTSGNSFRPSNMTFDKLNTTDSLRNHTSLPYNLTLVTGAPTTTASYGINAFLDKSYSLSYLHYATLAFAVSIIVGIAVSACTGFNKEKEIDKNAYLNFWSCCHRNEKKRCGPYRGADQDTTKL